MKFLLCIDSSGGALEVWLSVAVAGQTPQFILVQRVWCKGFGAQFILVQKKLKLAGLEFFSYRSKTGPFGNINETIWGETPARAAKCTLARHFPVAIGTQLQVSCLTHPGQMLFNADRQWLLVRSPPLLLSLVLSIHLEILTHIWEIFLTSAFLGSDIVVQNISVTVSFKLYLINLEPAFKQSSVSSGCVHIFSRTLRVSSLYIF